MTNTSRDTIVGLFEDQRSAEAVVDELIQDGFSRDQVHLDSGANYGGEAASGGSGLTGRAPAQHHGGFTGWLHSLFSTDEYAEDRGRYAEAIQRGSYVVAVDTEEGTRDQAVDIMNDHGAIDIDQHAAKHGYGAIDRTAAASDQATGSIPVVQEELQVGKRTVQRGGVRVYSRVIDQPVEQDVQLREEKVTVERRPVDRPLTDADRAGLRDQTVEVKEMAEEAVISKQARVVEEVRIGKESTERTQKVRDTVRRTEVQTENLGTAAATSYGDDFRKDFQTRYGSSGAAYDEYAPAYDFGYRMAGDSRYKDRNWSDVESTLKTDYLRNNPNSTWDQVKGAVRYGWEKVTGQR
ncbi:MAG: YsnF/AvaK domain-containing protein [Bryobacteraceae bacterium]